MQSLSNLFQNKIFRIPDYQRGYAWKKEQLIDFWDDIRNLPDNRYHYTGLLSLKEMTIEEASKLVNDYWLIKKGYKVFYVVDGQQRLTTFSILINEIVNFVKNLEKDKDYKEIVICEQDLASIIEKYILQKRLPQKIVTSYIFGYETDNPSFDYLIHAIYNIPAGGSIKETYYTKNLKYAKEFFIDCLQKLYETEGIESIENIFYTVTLRLMFNIHEIEDDYDVFVAFETMNNRGKKLTNLELLKNRMIYLTTLYDDKVLDESDKAELRKQINDTWKEVYYQLGRNQNMPLSDDDFLRAQWIMYYNYSRTKGNDYINYLLNKFSAKKVFEKKIIALEEDTVYAPNDVIDEEEDIVNGENDVTNEISKLQPGDIKSYVNSLKSVAEFWYYTYFPNQSSLSKEEVIWLERLNRIGIGYFRPIVTVALIPELKISVKKRILFFKAVERFIFISFRMAGSQSSYRSSEYYRNTRKLYFKEITIDDLITSLNDSSDNDAKNAIESFTLRIDKRFSTGDGFYGWKDLKYFFYEYEYEKALTTGIEKIGWEPFTKFEKDKVSIEHILPQTPSKWYWRNQFRQYSKKEIGTLSASLGNLLPLSQSVNSSLQNDSFDEKKKAEGKRKHGYVNGSHSEIEVSQYSEWNAKNILERGLHLLSFMERRWKIHFKDDEQKIKLLKLEDINKEREFVPELTKDPVKQDGYKIIPKEGNAPIQSLRYTFWYNFTKYCEQQGKASGIVSQTPSSRSSYDICVGKKGFVLFVSLQKANSLLGVGIYMFNVEVIEKAKKNKERIEDITGMDFKWRKGKKTSINETLIHSRDIDIHDNDKYTEYYDWIINCVDRLKDALEELDI